MAQDPRKAKTLGEACINPDGTADGAELLAFLSECLSPGHGVPEEEVRAMWDNAVAMAEAKKAKHDKMS